jgi:hypothetical protein
MATRRTQLGRLLGPTDFLSSLQSVLQHRRVAFSRTAAIAFIESCWVLIADDPDVGYWNERFIEAGAVEVPA